VCESRPTWLVDERTRNHLLPDGTPVVIRPLLYSDRSELARGFALLSPEARRRRFLVETEELSPSDLEYLTNLDFHHHRAWAAFLPSEPDIPGVGVARWVRDRANPAVAEAAVTVLDDYQARGIGTLLLEVLAEDAAAHGIRTLAAYVWWDNDVILEPLRAMGARITGDEPGVARVEVDLPGPDAAPGDTSLAGERPRFPQWFWDIWRQVLRAKSASRT
jgi:GNAT superfamily N-acetyltransferase